MEPPLWFSEQMGVYCAFPSREGGCWVRNLDLLAKREQLRRLQIKQAAACGDNSYFSSHFPFDFSFDLSFFSHFSDFVSFSRSDLQSIMKEDILCSFPSSPEILFPRTSVVLQLKTLTLH